MTASVPPALWSVTRDDGHRLTSLLNPDRTAGGHALAVALDGRYAGGLSFESPVEATRWAGELRRQFERGLSLPHLQLVLSGDPVLVRATEASRARSSP